MADQLDWATLRAVPATAANLRYQLFVGALFASFSAAQAGWVADDEDHLSIGHLAYVRDVSGTALTTNGGAVNWSPDNTPEVGHWGALGVDVGTNKFAAPTILDEGPALQAALDWCVENGKVLHGRTDRTFGTGQPLFAGTDDNDQRYAHGCGVVNINLCAVGVEADWGDDDRVITFGNASADPTAKFVMVIENVGVDCNFIAAGGTDFLGVTRSKISNVHQIRWRVGGVGMKVGNAAEIGDGQSADCSGSMFEYCWGAMRVFGDDGYTDGAEHQGTGLMVRCADARFHEAIFFTTSVCLDCAHFSQAKFTGGHFWPGNQGIDEADSYAAIIADCADGQFFGTRFEDGKVLIKGSETEIGTGFKHSFTGCEGNGYNGGATIVLEARVAGETAAALHFVGNNIDDDAVELTTSGSGSWADVECTFVGNSRRNGASAFVIQGKAQVFGPNMPTFSNNGDINAPGDVRAGGGVVIGRNQATGGGHVAAASFTGDVFNLTPTDLAGNLNFARSLQFNPADDAWRPEGGIILQSPNGTDYLLTVENDGTLGTTAL